VKHLLPHHLKIPGYFLILAGVALSTYWFHFDFRIMSPVFAIVSMYFGIDWFTTFRTNIADEIIILSLLTGFVLVVFSKEKNEDPGLHKIRKTTMFRAVFLNALIMGFVVIFFYGQAFTGMLLINIFLVFIIYLVLFYQAVKKHRADTQEVQD